MQFYIFYPNTKELVLLIYANDLYGVILLFLSHKRYRNSNHYKIVIFKFITLELAMWIYKRSFLPEMEKLLK